ncbi:NAD(P)-dependent alcohol dehydrogenase [Rhodococcus tibetensis]|uniref:NAD(P)-dependent alcohol dehydrogenase n=1 Tax=Rhodococcus tibetensis TaxID=2965064 RepID=A0ABT1QKC6_9NOCA|nr:NAD(P)-dependent alcohol dehydrogenase [Rhodococcus sp. FXJ9.536]MCQ4122098.1 NAD(P)-dependent alcohol dehydrogenase [Rhodococcus sp. FXJ9.536]
MQVRGAVLRDPGGRYELEDLTLRDVRAGELRVRIVGAGFCHTDLLPRRPDYAASLPIITGHEGAGIVEAIGPGTPGFDIGDHVVLSFDSCRACRNCVTGHPAYCDTFFTRNLSGAGPEQDALITNSHGDPVAARWFGQSSFATHSVVTATNAVKVDPDLPLEILGPLGCGIQTGAGSVLTALRVHAGSTLIVFGAGGVGLSAVMAGRVVGAAKIITVDLNPVRLDLSLELGATHTIDGSRDDVLDRLRDVTEGGAQFTLDTTGVPSVINTAVNALRPTGTCGLLGVQQGNLTLDPRVLAVGRTVTGILEGDAVPQVLIPQLLELWRQGRFPFDRMIKKYPLSDINQAEKDTLAGETIKPVLIP